MSTPDKPTERHELQHTMTNASGGSSSSASSEQAQPQVTQCSHVDHASICHLARALTAESRLPAFGGEFQPGLYKNPKDRKVANPAPLGLCAFALSSFILGLIEMEVRGVTEPNIIVGTAFAYGGLVQLLSGMWEMAVGNTFGATVLSSYGGFWISVGIIFTPGGFQIIKALEEADNGNPQMFYDSFGIMLFGWFIFTTLMLFMALKSTVAFLALFVVVDIAILLLGIGYLHRGPTGGMPNKKLLKAGGFFAILTAFLAWYNAYAGVADESNTFILAPVVHFPWSEKGRHARRERKQDAEEV
ncbi:GPR FUN34 family protein [Aspergillus sp. HF37]|nr:GPR FUN34 family protein [Aspergillus sp. HF37]